MFTFPKELLDVYLTYMSEIYGVEIDVYLDKEPVARFMIGDTFYFLLASQQHYELAGRDKDTIKQIMQGFNKYLVNVAGISKNETNS